MTISTDREKALPRYARWLATTNVVTRHIVAAYGPECINLSGGLPAPEVYPLAAIEAATQRALARFKHRAVSYGPVEGMKELRMAIAARASTPRQRFGAENVLVTTGSLQALDLLGKILVEPGETILAQFPTYLGALDAWRPRTPTYRRLDWDADAASLGSAVSGAQFVYCVPNFSNPTGALIATESRQRLLAAAQGAGGVLVEDDPYGALFYDGPALPSLLDLSSDGSEIYRGPVVHLGTLSKSIGPGLRIGWAIAEPKMIEMLSLAKQGADIGTGTFAQGVAVELLDAGIDRAVLPDMLALYARRRDALVSAAGEHLGLRFDFTAPVGGMFLWLTAKDPAFDTDALWPIAFAAGVSFCPGSVFDPTARLKHAIRLNFTLNDEAQLVEGVRRLARAVERQLQAPA